MLFWTALVQGGHGKNCPVKRFEVYVETLGFLYFGRIYPGRGVEELRHASKVTNKR